MDKQTVNWQRNVANTPTTSKIDNQNTSKFLGGKSSHDGLTSSSKNDKLKKIQQARNQATIMETMGARYRKMVSPFNTNNINQQP